MSPLRLFPLLFVACTGPSTDKAATDDAEPTDATDLTDATTDTDPGVAVVTCAPVPTSTDRCDVVAGDERLWLRGEVLAPDTVYVGGSVVVDAAGAITCVGCDCEAEGATRVDCGEAVISPGLIDAHEHITFAWTGPSPTTDERYEDRHDYRTGSNGHTKITAPGAAPSDAVRWNELRHLLAGTTSVVGSGGVAGLVRNLDRDIWLEGLEARSLRLDTFPLGDSSGVRLTAGCSYPSLPDAESLATVDAWLPHVGDGIDAPAHHELACLTGQDTGAVDPVDDRTAVIGGAAFDATDLALLAERGAGLVWSPRTDLRLYGQTVPVTAAMRLGLPLALGTDWLATGSMNLQRELACAAAFDDGWLGDALTDADLWAMVTANPADLSGYGALTGRLAAGLTADVAIFAGHGHAAVVDAGASDVVLVLRGGRALYGDAVLVDALRGADTCEDLDVCGVAHALCLDEIGGTLEGLIGSAGTTYPLFTCATPPDEPPCHPQRGVSVSDASVYTGVATAGDADGDGVPDASDLCPDVFDPIRPLDGGVQADVDADGLGDACDPCPTTVDCP